MFSHQHDEDLTILHTCQDQLVSREHIDSSFEDSDIPVYDLYEDVDNELHDERLISISKTENQFIVKKEHIPQTLSYNYVPSFDDYDETDVETQEKQSISFLVDINHHVHEISKPKYDDYQMESEEVCQEQILIEILSVNTSILQIPFVSFLDYQKEKTEIINEAVKVEQSVLIQLEQPYFINRTKILEKDFSFLNHDDSLMDDQVVIFYQLEDPVAILLRIIKWSEFVNIHIL
jgi:hypothetical protein